jgi:hypothetical protein
MTAKWFSNKEVEMLLTSLEEETLTSGIKQGHVKHDVEVAEVMSDACEDYFPGMVML